MELGPIGPAPNCSLVCRPRGIGVRPRPRAIAERGVYLCERDCPGGPPIVEHIGGKREEPAPLGIVEDPCHPAVRRDVAEESRRIDRRGHGMEHALGIGQISIAE